MANAKSKNTVFLAVLGLLLAGGIVGGILISKNMGKSKQEISRDTAVTQMDKKLKKISVQNLTARKATVEIAGNNLAEELPDISKYPMTVTGRGDINIEIISSTEKATGGTDGWLIDVAEDFNSSHYTIDGQWATVSVRPIASGAAIDYIISNKYVPEAFSPSNVLWGDMIAAENVKIDKVCDRLAGNTAGILISKDTHKKLNDTYGKVDISTIVQATIKSEITMGYTNPYASSTGLNFLVAALDGAELLLADGNRRPLQNPKRKNPAHVQATKQTLSLEGLTDKALRAVLNPMNEKAKRPLSKQNQIR